VAEIAPNGYRVLDRVGAVIGRAAHAVRVEGHTDNVPIHTPRYPSNWELSVARAVNVVKYLAASGAVAPERLSAVGYGDSKPRQANLSPQGRAGNRRVEIIAVMQATQSSIPYTGRKEERS
jgi:chemotaxis protein MotB